MGVQQGTELEAPRVVVRRPAGTLDPWAALPDDAREGLGSRPRRLPSKYHYDARGSALFERITELPEYYQTRTEAAILEQVADDLVAALEPRALVEFGSGSASKTRILLDAMARRGSLEAYGALEVSESALLASALELVEDYDELVVEGVLADFLDDVELPFADRSRLILFLGSTIGNLKADEAVSFLRRTGARMSERDGFLIGFDLVKDRERLVAAYNDSAGVTEQFSLNVLRVLNRELDGDFPIESFDYRGIYNEDQARIEAYLVARRPLEARLGAIGLDIELDEGDTIRTELSHKYTLESVRSLLTEAGLELVRWDTDPEQLFGIGLARLPRSP